MARVATSRGTELRQLTGCKQVDWGEVRKSLKWRQERNSLSEGEP